MKSCFCIPVLPRIHTPTSIAMPKTNLARRAEGKPVGSFVHFATR